MRLRVLIFVCFLAAALSQQPVPDAPSATRPAPNFPAGTKPATAGPESQSSASQPPPSEAEQKEEGTPPSVETPKVLSDVGAIIRTSVNFVAVPVTVKDDNGRNVFGLQSPDFSIYEDGVKQELRYFTSDPYPLSAAVVIDQGMSDTTMRKVNQTLGAITGAFSQYDEVAVYTYGNTVRKHSDFQAANDELRLVLQRSKSSGRQGGVPVTSGPLAAGPTINGRPADPAAPHVITPNEPSRVLNDALLKAAVDLSKRERARRRVIFLISDGREAGSDAKYSEVMKVLLTHQITVYALGTDAAAIPFYEKMNRVRVLGQGTANIIPKYVSATGGQLETELSTDAIERAYAQLTGDARNQYTLGYNSKSKVIGGYRTIEVRVKRPGLKVYARDGYYPLPPAPPAAEDSDPTLK